jgi:hypothetical protein
MKIRVTVMAPKDRCVDSHEYDDALPWPCIADLSLELRGYKEWSAYLRTTDRLTIQIVEEGGFGDVELHRDRDTDAGQTIAEAIGVDALGYPQDENLPRQPWIDDFIEATDWYTGEVLGNLNRWSSVAGKEAMILLNMATGLGHTL